MNIAVRFIPSCLTMELEKDFPYKEQGSESAF